MRFDCIPPRRTAQQKGAMVRNGRVMFFTKHAVEVEQQTMIGLILSRLPAGWEPLDGPVEVAVRLCYPYRKNEPKRVVAAGEEIPHGARPDLDNILKGCLDAIVKAQVIRDDGQIAGLSALKTWGPKGYWGFRVSPCAGPAPAMFPYETRNEAVPDVPGQALFDSIRIMPEAGADGGDDSGDGEDD